MLGAIIAVVAALAGVFLGIWLRSRAAMREVEGIKHQAALAAETATVEREALRVELATVRAELAEAKTEITTLAGFKPLAEDRALSLERLTVERDNVRAELATAAEAHKGELARAAEQARVDARHNAEQTRQQSAQISKLEAELKAERAGLAEKIALLEQSKKTLADQFQTLAAEILEQKSKSFSEGSQKELGTLIAPLKTQIEEFRKKVEEAQTDSKTGVTRLETLVGALNGLNQQLSEEARNLTTALRGSSKAQGDWGEFILRDLLEKAGLKEGEQYSFQQSHTGLDAEDGNPRNARTDVIVALPGGRSLVIDSKVSLTAYTDSVNAATEDERKAALKAHLASLRGHIAGLAKSGYHKLPGVEAPDFVVMFVPVEPAFLVAIQQDASLWADAYAQNILLVGPTTLLYVIRIVNVLWQQEAQSRNVREVMDRGAALYEKFVGFVADLEAVGKALRAAEQSYTAATKKLSEGSGNLVRQVEMLKSLGVRTTKRLPQALLDAAGVEADPQLADGDTDPDSSN